MNNKTSITALMSSFGRAIRDIWKRLTGQERLYRMERSLQKKMLKCENEEQWEKLNQRRKKIRQQRHRIQTRCRMMAVAGIILLAAGTVKLGMAAFTGNTESQKKKPNDGEKLYNLIYETYIAPEKLSLTDILYRLDMSPRHYYRLREQAITILSIRLWAAPGKDVDFWFEMLTLLEGLS